jgi:arabinogalactan endo-1,4-beta-galactosidase
VGADGTVTIAITGDLPAGAWGNVDKVSLALRRKSS